MTDNQGQHPVLIGPGIEMPPLLIQRFRRYHGQDRTRAWMAALPGLLDTLCTRWGIELEPELPPISFNLVLFGTSRSLGDVVLKLSPPSPEVLSEMEAIRQTSAHGSVLLHASDPEAAFMVQARIRPGTMLLDHNLEDDEATRIGAAMMRTFWRPPIRRDHLFPLERWLRDLLEYTGTPHPDVPHDLILRIQGIARELLASTREEVLLHGDMHHQNILWDDLRGWVLIDPKGLVGDRGYEVGTWMMNPWSAPSKPGFHALAQRRLDILSAELGEDRQRLAQWAATHATLSLCWALTEGQPEDLASDIAFAQAMARLLD